MPAVAARTDRSAQNRLFWVPPALLLIAASLAKASAPWPFLYELSNYGFHLPPEIEAILALILPPLEVLVGMSLLFEKSPRAAVAAAVLLLVFSGGILFALPAGYLHRCGCLGPEKLDPVLALLKNGLAILLLIIGSFPTRRRAEGGNSWGSFAVIAGGLWSGPASLVVYMIGAIFAWRGGVRDLFAFCAALGLGLILRLAGFPLVYLIVAATVLYFFRSNTQRVSMMAPVVMALLVFILTSIAFAWPTTPQISPPLLQVGRPLPDDLKSLSALPHDDRRQALILFLNPDCEECRDWLPQATALALRSFLPPLAGLVSGSAEAVEGFREREAVQFSLFPLKSDLFTSVARRTPLLVFMEADTVRAIFAEGSLPTAAELEEAVKHAGP